MNQLTLGTPPVPKLTINQGQQEAADAFFQFLFTPDKEMGISGPGGVGKTFLMGHLIDEILPTYHTTCSMMGITPEYTEVVMTATTNKAAEQLAQSTGRPCSTIHSFLNLKVQDDYKTGQSKLTKNLNWMVHTNKIIFIDECSMIDHNLWEKINEGTQNCKIIYVGDHCQLAPVMETISSIYRQGIPFYNLTEPMRTKVPELQALNQQLRNTVETGDFHPIRLVPGIIDLLDDQQIQQAMAQDFQHQTHDARILAYTNNQAILFNDHIRGLRQLPDELTVGEMLVNNSAIHLGRSMLSAEKEVELIHLADDTEMVFISPTVELEVRRAKLRTSLNEVHTNVPIPVDRAHHAALIKHFQGIGKRSRDWSGYFLLKNDFPDLRPRDASTVHKAQGSTFDTTYVDLGNISTCHQPNQVARMLYVAVSRSRSRVIFYGELAEKYGGIIQ